MALEASAVLAHIQARPRTFADLCALLQVKVEDRRDLETVIQRMRKKGLIRFQNGFWTPSSGALPKKGPKPVRRDAILSMAKNFFAVLPKCRNCNKPATHRTVVSFFPSDVQFGCDDHPFADLYKVEPVPYLRDLGLAKNLFTT